MTHDDWFKAASIVQSLFPHQDDIGKLKFKFPRK